MSAPSPLDHAVSVMCLVLLCFCHNMSGYQTSVLQVSGKDSDGMPRPLLIEWHVLHTKPPRTRGCNDRKVRSLCHHRATQFCHIYLTGFSCSEEEGQLAQVKSCTLADPAALLVCFPFSRRVFRRQAPCRLTIVRQITLPLSFVVSKWAWKPSQLWCWRV